MSIGSREPDLELVHVLWRMRAASDKVITATLYLVETGPADQLPCSGQPWRFEYVRSAIKTIDRHPNIEIT